MKYSGDRFGDIRKLAKTQSNPYINRTKPVKGISVGIAMIERNTKASSQSWEACVTRHGALCDLIGKKWLV